MKFKLPFLTLLGIVLLSTFAFAATYTDSNGKIIDQTNNGVICFGVRIRFNLTQDMYFNGTFVASNSDPTNAYFYNGTAYGDGAQHDACDVLPGLYSNTTFSGTTAKMPTPPVVHNGEEWTVMMDANGANYNNFFSSTGVANTTGNTTKVIYDCGIYTTCNSANVFGIQGMLLSDLNAPATPSDVVTLQTATLTVNAANTTFTLHANATTTNGTSITYTYKAYKDGVNFLNGTWNGARNVTSTATFASTGNGTYYANVTAGDGMANSSTLQTNSVTVTTSTPPPPPAPATTNDDAALTVAINMLALGVLLIMFFGFVPKDRPELRAAFYWIIGIVSLVLVVSLLFLLA